jgi:hypothetical protein
MSCTPIALDFAPFRARGKAVGLGLVLIGLISMALVYLDYKHGASQRSALELQLDAINHHRTSSAPVRGNDPIVIDAAAVAAELNTPWSQLLADLESASRDQQQNVAVLSIESDREKHSVRLIAESRTLQLALAYVQRLQGSRALRFPTLDSHEIRTDDPERPVRFQVTAEWRQAS